MKKSPIYSWDIPSKFLYTHPFPYKQDKTTRYALDRLNIPSKIIYSLFHENLNLFVELDEYFRKNFCEKI